MTPQKVSEDVLSAQPGQRNARVFQGIIVEYPTISTYPEYEGKPYFSIKYTENGQEFIGYGTYQPEALSEYLKEYFMSPAQPGEDIKAMCGECDAWNQYKNYPQQKWIPVTERLPEREGRYVCTYTYDGKKDVFMFRFEDGDFLVPWYVDAITAWYKPLDPWEGGQNDTTESL